MQQGGLYAISLESLLWGLRGALRWVRELPREKQLLALPENHAGENLSPTLTGLHLPPRSPREGNAQR